MVKGVEISFPGLLYSGGSGLSFLFIILNDMNDI